MAGTALLIVVVVLGAIVWNVDGPLAIERTLASHFVATADAIEPFDLGRPDRWPFALMVVFGEPGFAVPVMVGLVGVALWRRDVRLAMVCLFGPAIAVLLTQEVGKPFVDRLHDGHLSYPSGHNTGATALAMTGYLVLRRCFSVGAARRWLALLACIPLTTGVGVVLLRWHYPTDSIGGWCMGAGIVLLLAAALLDRRPVRS